MRMLTLALLMIVVPLEAQEPLSHQLFNHKVASELAQDRYALLRAIRSAMADLDSRSVHRVGYRSQLIDLIRQHRAVECTDLLLAHLEEPEPVSGGIGPLVNLPAAETLVDFGSPIYTRVFQKWVGHPRTKRQLMIVACVMVQIDGQRVATARLDEQLEWRPNGPDYDAANRESLPRTKNLRALLEYVQIDFADPRNQLTVGVPELSN